MKRIINITLVFAGIYILNLMCNPLLSQNSQGFQASDFMGEPLEKVKLYTDRDIYIAGETIWFSAFSGIINESAPSPISQIIYIEIYNAGNKVFVREKFKLNNGQASGHLVIPDETPTGYYFIRAYTMYLRNFPPENYFISGITIINPEIPQSGGNVTDEIKMVPEGGNLINGIQSKLALKIPYKIVHQTSAAFLVNTKGEQSDEINIYPNGLCMIDLIPNDSARCYLKLVFHNGDSLHAFLPGPQKAGFLMQTKIEGNELHAKTFRKESNPTSSSNFILKVLSDSYQQKYKAEIIMKDHISETVIPLSKLPHGLSYVVATDKNDSILSFNPIYLESEISDNIQIVLQKNSFETREKVELDIQLPPSQTNDFKLMTVSVVKKGTAIIMDDLLPEIVSKNPCLLESYFEKNAGRSPDLIKQINISMMLFSANALNSFLASAAQPKSRIYFPEIRDVSISGFLLEKKTRKPMKDVQMFASILFEDFQLHTTKTMEDGSFVFSLNHLTGKRNLYLFPDIRDGGEHELFINSDFSTKFRNLYDCDPVIDSNYLQFLEELYINQQIAVNFPRKSVDQQKIQKLSPWFGVEMLTINLADYIDLTSFREVINEIVPSVRLKENNDQYRFTVFDNNSQIAYENPLVLLDHIPVTNINELIKIHPTLIEKIEVMSQPYILGNYTIWGLILITTKTDDFARIKLPEESAFINYQMQKNTSSFVPLDFTEEDIAKSSNPFFNTVLYWGSFYKNDIPGKQISFYTSDHIADYDVIIRGINGNGRLYKGSAAFSVTAK